ncbi:hypothetical protein X943_000156 [Babesia divergens]|uniref:Uncharacterized protein n=1 Tax=Babesia divergens TaxID=32595 RepID=A0AAD9GAA7_BABDI|nr:hypothetical protein X943_000156 [Babesia divergens]
MDSKGGISSNCTDGVSHARLQCNLEDTSREMVTLMSIDGKELSADGSSSIGSISLNISPRDGTPVDQTLPMYNAYKKPKAGAALGNMKDLMQPRRIPKWSRLQRRAMSVVFCLCVGILAIKLSSWVINWAEEHRKSDTNHMAIIDGDIHSIQEGIAAIHSQLNKLRELTYANSVAINEITKGAIKIPGFEEISAKHQKFGKNRTSINQAATYQRFDKSQISHTRPLPSSASEADFQLHPIVHEAEIL